MERNKQCLRDLVTPSSIKLILVKACLVTWHYGQKMWPLQCLAIKIFLFTHAFIAQLVIIFSNCSLGIQTNCIFLWQAQTWCIYKVRNYMYHLNTYIIKIGIIFFPPRQICEKDGLSILKQSNYSVYLLSFIEFSKKT